MKTRTFCPSCGGYRDIEDGHRVCTFCEYLDEQRDSAKALPRELSPCRLNIDGKIFIISFCIEQDQIGIVIDTSDPHYELLADCLTIVWKLKPVELLESLCDHRVVTVGGKLYTITFDDDPEPGESDRSLVTICDDETELTMPTAFFSAVVQEMVRSHFQVAGRAHFPWLTKLSSSARARLV